MLKGKRNKTLSQEKTWRKYILLRNPSENTKIPILQHSGKDKHMDRVKAQWLPEVGAGRVGGGANSRNIEDF